MEHLLNMADKRYRCGDKLSRGQNRIIDMDPSHKGLMADKLMQVTLENMCYVNTCLYY